MSDRTEQNFRGVLVSMLVCGLAFSAACDSKSKPIVPRSPDLDGFIGPAEGPRVTDQDGAMAPPDDLGSSTDNAACAAAVTVAAGATVSGDTSGSTQTLDGTCVSYASGAVVFYTASVPAGNKLIARATPTDGIFDPVLRVLEDCTASTCAASADSTYEGDAEVVTYANTGSSPKQIIIAVGGYQDPGAFDLSVTIATLPANGVCTAAIPVTAGAALTGQDASGAADVPSACLTYATGGVLYYSTTIPARTSLSVQATPTGTMWDPAIRVLSQCAALTCLSSGDDGYGGDVETSSYRNETMAAMPVIIAIGGHDDSDTGTFDLQLTETALLPPPANAVCSAAITVSNGTHLTMQDSTEAVDDLTAACLPGALGSVIYYKATVPAGNRLDAKVTPSGTTSWDPAVRLLSACGATSCLGDADINSSGGAETLTYKNTSASSTPVVLAVGSYDAAISGTFDLDVSITVLPPPPTNITCAQALAVSNGTNRLGEDLSAATVGLTNACLSYAPGNVLFYKITIPNNKTLGVKATPGAGGDPVIRVLSACGATNCLTSEDSGFSNDTENLSYKNTTGAPLPVIFAVGDYSSTPSTFDLNVTIQ